VDHEFLRELFAPFRPVVVRKLFVGAGISVNGVTFAIVVRSAIYLKVDEDSIPAFEREGSQPFTYTRAKGRNKPVSMSYWRLPERLYDDPDELATWAERSLAIAQRAKAIPRSRKPRKKEARKPSAPARR
jgi:DNA transformation protein and related proteins